MDFPPWSSALRIPEKAQMLLQKHTLVEAIGKCVKNEKLGKV